MWSTRFGYWCSPAHCTIPTHAVLAGAGRSLTLTHLHRHEGGVHHMASSAPRDYSAWMSPGFLARARRRARRPIHTRARRPASSNPDITNLTTWGQTQIPCTHGRGTCKSSGTGTRHVPESTSSAAAALACSWRSCLEPASSAPSLREASGGFLGNTTRSTGSATACISSCASGLRSGPSRTSPMLTPSCASSTAHWRAEESK